MTIWEGLRSISVLALGTDLLVLPVAAAATSGHRLIGDAIAGVSHLVARMNVLWRRAWPI